MRCTAWRVGHGAANRIRHMHSGRAATAWAQRGGHSSGSRSYSSHSSHRSYSSRSYSSPSHSYSTHSYSSKPIHVGAYTRSNGTFVHSHSRSLPGTAPKHLTTPRTYTPRSKHSSASRTHYAAPLTYSTARSTITLSRRTTSLSHRSASLSPRGSRGKEKRSAEAKDAFKHLHPCPANGRASGPCPGYVIDHKIALACGGSDSPFNMQWQTAAEGKAKDKWERKGCR
jgi:hypothetical protein